MKKCPSGLQVFFSSIFYFSLFSFFFVEASIKWQEELSPDNETAWSPAILDQTKLMICFTEWIQCLEMNLPIYKIPQKSGSNFKGVQNIGKSKNINNHKFASSPPTSPRNSWYGATENKKLLLLKNYF